MCTQSSSTFWTRIDMDSQTFQCPPIMSIVGVHGISALRFPWHTKRGKLCERNEEAITLVSKLNEVSLSLTRARMQNGKCVCVCDARCRSFRGNSKRKYFPNQTADAYPLQRQMQRVCKHHIGSASLPHPHLLVFDHIRV